MNKREILNGLYKEFKVLREKCLNHKEYDVSKEVAEGVRDGFLYAISLIEDNFKKE